MEGRERREITRFKYAPSLDEFDMMGYEWCHIGVSHASSQASSYLLFFHACSALYLSISAALSRTLLRLWAKMLFRPLRSSAV